MRPRKKTNLAPRLAACAPVIIADVNEKKGRLTELFASPQAPLRLELGCGKGRFACELAMRHPDINFIAVERELNVAVIAAERAMRGGLSAEQADTAEKPLAALPNLRFLLGDADELLPLFDEDSIDRLYINFCDPWHKRRQYKNRLTYRERLTAYRRILRTGGELHFKTDNYMLYHFSIFEFAAAFPAYFSTTDLHQSEHAAENCMTEYEEYFSRLGQPIYSIRARKEA